MEELSVFQDVSLINFRPSLLLLFFFSFFGFSCFLSASHCTVSCFCFLSFILLGELHCSNLIEMSYFLQREASSRSDKQSTILPLLAGILGPKISMILNNTYQVLNIWIRTLNASCYAWWLGVVLTCSRVITCNKHRFLMMSMFDIWTRSSLISFKYWVGILMTILLLWTSDHLGKKLKLNY